MKTSEIIYNALVLAMAGLMVVTMAMYILVLIPQAPDDRAQNLYRFIVFIYGFFALLFGSTAIINLARKRLVRVATIIQIVFLFLFIYTSPLAIWGIVLLAKQTKRIAEENGTRPAILGEEWDS